MANGEPIPKRVPATMTVSEIHSLVDRLLSRGVTKLSNQEPEQQADLRLAARVIRALLRNVNHSDTITVNGD